MKKTASTPDRLPEGVLASDLKQPQFDDYRDLPYDDRTFELWHTTSFGWCIPTLFISRAGRGQSTDRTYAVTLDGKPVRVGRGPHVTRIITVYVRTSRMNDLQKFLDVRKQGQAKAGEIRDRISSRRAQGQMERASGHSHWRWEV